MEFKKIKEETKRKIGDFLIRHKLITISHYSTKDLLPKPETESIRGVEATNIVGLYGEYHKVSKEQIIDESFDTWLHAPEMKKMLRQFVEVDFCEDLKNKQADIESLRILAGLVPPENLTGYIKMKFKGWHR